MILSIIAVSYLMVLLQKLYEICVEGTDENGQSDTNGGLGSTINICVVELGRKGGGTSWHAKVNMLVSNFNLMYVEQRQL